MKLGYSGIIVAALLMIAFPSLILEGQQPAPQAPRPGFRAAPALFQQNCGTCHASEGRQIDGRDVLPLPMLQSYSPERVYEVLAAGTMHAEAANLTDVQKRQIAEFVAARPFNSEAGEASNMTNHCATNPPMDDPSAGPAWNGWSAGAANARFQHANGAGLTVDQASRLRVKWAFGVPNAAEMHSQPAVVSGRVFFGSDAAHLYSLDADSGCIYWSFHAESGIRSAPIIAPITGHTGVRYAVYFVDVLTRVYALDAQTGRLLWRVRAGDHPRAKSTGSPTLYDGRVYVPISSMETTTGAVLTYECCSFRGHVVALDANTGDRIWRTFMIAEEPAPRGTNRLGVTLLGPSGGSVWNSPTVDPKRRRVYVGTGNAYTSPAAKGTDSVIAMDMDTGTIVWQHQEFEGDAYIGNCRAVGEPGDNCPETLGPDWDFGGASMILHTLPDGRDVIIAGSKGGISMAFDLDGEGAVVWKTNLAERPPSAAGLIVFGGAADGETVYYGLNQPGGGIAAVRLSDGVRTWTAAPLREGGPGQSPAVTAIPGLLFAGTSDGMLRAVSAADGRVIWEYNTSREFEAVNGVPARGGSFGAAGPTVAGGMVFVGSGYGAGAATPGNVLLAFGPE